MSSFGSPQLAVRIVGDPSGLEASLTGSAARIRGWADSTGSMVSARLGAALAGGALIQGLRSTWAAADEANTSFRRLAGGAKLSGVNLSTLTLIAHGASRAFKISEELANDLTEAVSRLTVKAGAIERTGDAIAALMDLAAAKGMDPAQAMERLRQAIAGSDEGVEAFFSRNPSALYAEFAQQIGTTAGRLNDQQKAQALLNAVMDGGSRTRGEYAEWLDTAEGRTFKLQQRTREAEVNFGRATNGIRTTIVPALTTVAEVASDMLMGFELWAAHLPVSIAKMKLWAAEAGASFRGFISNAAATLSNWLAGLRDLPSPIRAMLGFGDAQIGGVGLRGVAAAAHRFASWAARDSSGEISQQRAEVERTEAAYENLTREILRMRAAATGSPITPPWAQGSGSPAGALGGSGSAPTKAADMPSRTPRLDIQDGGVLAGVTAAFKRALADQGVASARAREFALALERASSTARGFGDVFHVLGLGRLGRVADGVGSAIDGIDSFRRSGKGLMSGAGLSLMAGVMSAVVPLIQGIGGLFGRNPEHVSLMRENNAALDRLRLSLDASAGTFGGQAGVLALIDRLQAGKFGDRMRLSGEVEQQLRFAAAEQGIELFDSKGRLVAATLGQLEEAIRTSALSVEKFADSLQGFNRLAEVRRDLFEMDGDAAAVLRDQYAALLRGLGERAETSFGLVGLDLDTGAGREAFEAALRRLFEAFEAGALDPFTDLAGFGSAEEFLNALLGADDALDQLAETTGKLNASMLNVPSGYRLMGFRAWQNQDGLGGLTAPPAGPAVGTPVVNNFTVHVNARDRTAAEIFDEVEIEARRRARQGGSGNVRLKLALGVR